MEFTWTAEHQDLRAAVRRVLASKAPVEKAREQVESGARHDPEVWRTLADQLGLPALGVPEELGGMGGTLVDRAIVAEEMGAVLYGGPFLPTAVLATEVLLALADDEGAQQLLGRIAEGGTTATVAVVEGPGPWSADALHTTASGGRLNGDKVLVLDGAEADVVLVLAAGEAGPGWYAVDGAELGSARTAQESLDRTRPMARLALRDVVARPLGAPGTGWPALERMRTVAGVLVAAEQVGLAGALVRRTAEYATTRRQFGRPIGSFQGVKHRLADMEVRHQMARSAAYWAAWQEPGSAELALGSLVARSYCSEGLLQTAKDTIQLHGGIGFTWEHDAHLYLRRARVDATLLGTPAEARAALVPHVLTSEPAPLAEVTR
jgi:alkylation response protein AidB-like acyl-CoA dehydrogenase